MSETATIWRKRVAGWRASGETAEVYSERHGWPTSTLRYWSSRLRREAPTTAPAVRLAQLVRVPQQPQEVARGTIVIELQDVHARITVASEADRETLAMVLEMLDRRGGQ